jgi:hypothetical protein
MTVKNKQQKRIVRTTVDQKHNEISSKFRQQKENLPEKKIRLKKLNQELEKERKNKNNLSKEIEIVNKIKNLSIDINNIENGTYKLNYLDSLDYVESYYDMVNNKNIQKKSTMQSRQINVQGGILSYLTDKPVRQKQNAHTTKKHIMNREEIHDQYSINMTNSYGKKIILQQNTKCENKKCKGLMFSNKTDEYYMCNVCGCVADKTISTEKPNYNEPNQETGAYAYKRINHLTEILSQLQAKETTDIPEEVFESVYYELRKRKINKNSLDIFSLGSLLKKLGLRKYCEHVPFMLQKINGKKPPNFSRQIENTIKGMFREIQKPFEMYCPRDRKNFLNYSYVLHKFCELLDLDKYLCYFPLLKNHSKLTQHDKIWKNICDRLRWKFYKSI